MTATQGVGVDDNMVAAVSLYWMERKKCAFSFAPFLKS